MWRALDGLKRVPTLLVRGATSDVLAAGVATRMVDVLEAGELVTIPATGHAPTLDEPAVISAIDRLLARIGTEPAFG